jgi:hypothetical protein
LVVVGFDVVGWGWTWTCTTCLFLGFATIWGSTDLFLVGGVYSECEEDGGISGSLSTWFRLSTSSQNTRRLHCKFWRVNSTQKWSKFYTLLSGKWFRSNFYP